VEAADAMRRVAESPGSLSAERVARARAVAAEQGARVGELDVSANVAGASIEVDGVEVAKTPLAKPLRVKGGPHRVGVVASGYAPSRKEVDVASGAKEAIKFELAPTDKRLAHLEVRANVAGAVVSVDGAPVGETPFASTLAVLPGAHELEAKRAGYHTARRHADVGEGSTGEVRFELEQDEGAIRAEGGDLTLTVNEPQPVVFVDGKPQASALSALHLAPGPHHVRVERAGFFPIERDVDVPTRGRVEVRVTLEPTADFRASYEKKARFYRTGAYVGFIAGGAVAAGGLTLALYAKSKRDEHGSNITQKQASGECTSSSPMVLQDCQTFLTKEQADFNRNDSYMIAGWVVTAVGGAIAGTGLVLLLVGDDPHRYDAPEGEKLGAARPAATPSGVAIAPSFALLPGGGFLGVRGAF
ncbi:MAG TPA: PEGA domain-containing protein, partial [Byssovorax sp.]